MRSDGQRALSWGYVGRIEYDRAEALQRRLREEVRRGERPDVLLLLEHPPVYTLGRSASRAEILLPDEELERRGITVAECDRGGQVTYHGPGQLVGYPILDLNPDRRDVRRYVRNLQAVLVATLERLGINAEGRMEQPEIGVWVGEKKIGSIGVHLARWITTHGFALNVSTDLAMFGGIVACGMPSVEMTSIEVLTGTKPSLEEVASICAAAFGRVFHSSLTTLDLSLEEEERWASVS
ncbi:MAG: lipoyl(octanoyl) transferase LipB [Acidobacteriota bacterium]|nr:lipoyl(octanoyl) transferase LipB [Acidobacteriota bacterium]